MSTRGKFVWLTKNNPIWFWFDSRLHCSALLDRRETDKLFATHSEGSRVLSFVHFVVRVGAFSRNQIIVAVAATDVLRQETKRS